MTHKITPHKGGRTEAIYFRCTPETKRNLKAIADRHGISVADWIDRQVELTLDAQDPQQPVQVAGRE